MKLSYESGELITELKEDIMEFGDTDVWAISKVLEGTRFYTDYDFLNRDLAIEGEVIPSPISLEIGEKKEKMKASQLLRILEEQNRL